MVRDSRVILDRDVRHSILKITQGGDDRNELDSGDEENRPAVAPRAGPPYTPTDASPEDLHRRHVDAEHHRHEHEKPAPAQEEAGDP
jgi:glycerol-3-phosphate O-acyltransferase